MKNIEKRQFGMNRTAKKEILGEDENWKITVHWRRTDKVIILEQTPKNDSASKNYFYLQEKEWHKLKDFLNIIYFR